ncbi:accessory Sec system protein Asp2 [Streptococcus sp. B01]|uniref:accessory Sec system protein Asp2 n=1 Tax=Streptococcus sp. B01 TaxID=2928734 RepID=UPI00211B3FAE|nr:accessory Sec system protein Asp2 [Streptococcus sp. B01]MCQ9212141.1 accessory Sec system protein Asp2 [Streptococcus sp. B01]
MKILQIGQVDWAEEVEQFPEDVEWLFSRSEEIPHFLEEQKKLALAKLPAVEEGEEPPKVRLHFDAVFITDETKESDLEPLMNLVEAYGLYHLSGLNLKSEQPYGIFRRKVLRELKVSGTQEEIIRFLHLTLFSGQYGAKLKLPEIDVNPMFTGKLTYEGHVSVSFEGDFGEDFEPLFSFRYNLSSFPVALELWLEYIKVFGDNHIRLELTPMRQGSIYDMMDPILLSEKDLEEPYILVPNEEIGFYAVTVYAQGSGKLSFGPLHWRYSRIGLGRFVLGGERYHDEKRQEFIYYFNPGDLKPPMNVYFSGFRPAEGFEGFGIMKSLKAPFMLIGDPRLEGGGFYSGTENLETAIKTVIQESLDYLGFSSSDLILSGLSMGTFGALYYASHFNPYGVIVGKPFTNVGDTAAGMKLKRPDEFETSADVLLNVTGGVQEEHIEQLNQKFWDTFSQSDFPHTNFAIAYMENDDYDGEAAHRLIEHLSDKQAHIYTKGYEGRHNDNSSAINKWFIKQYVNLLEKGYGRNYS